MPILLSPPWELGLEPFPVILADPPWDYDNQVQHGGKNKPYTSSVTSFYDTMTLAELQALPVKSIAAKKAILFLWTTGPQLERSIALLPAWGFKYKTIAFVWDKERMNPGAYTMSQHEFCIAAVRGSIPKPRGARNVRQLVREPRTVHSKKPAEVHRRIGAMFPEQRKLELFARGPFEGWTVWGNEVSI